MLTFLCLASLCKKRETDLNFKESESNKKPIANDEKEHHHDGKSHAITSSFSPLLKVKEKTGDTKDQFVDPRPTKRTKKEINYQNIFCIQCLETFTKEKSFVIAQRFCSKVFKGGKKALIWHIFSA